DDVSHFKWVLATADSYKKIGLHLWKEKKPDLLIVYIEGTDSTAHLFGHLFRAGTLSGELAEQQKRYGDAVEGIYQYADRLVGEYMAAMDDRTTLVVLSDHGFELGKLQDDPSKTRDMRRVSERFHNPEGILYLYGRNVKPRAMLDRPGLPDVAPTLLALAGLPPAADMPGRILAEGFARAPRTVRVPSYEGGMVAAANPSSGDPAADPAILEQLKSLGYIGDTRSTTGERNLAAIEFQKGRYAEAAEAYRKLVKENPDDAGLRTSLAGALGAQGKYDQALKELATAIKLEPLNPEAYHNRGVIFERKNDKAAAVKEYRTAIRYNPQYEPSRDALARLTGSANPYETMSDSDRLAAQIAERAADDARRGDYRAAMKKLDEAERVAPRLSLLQQYRSNVAYLQGDGKGAIAALEKAIKLEPDNALYRENLRRLQQGPKTAKTPARR
ncbi:MAG: tetratricopeptide repeat protein, partial [Candidatus Binatia bacterium]